MVRLVAVEALWKIDKISVVKWKFKLNWWKYIGVNLIFGGYILVKYLKSRSYKIVKPLVIVGTQKSWHDDIVKEIAEYRNKFGKKDYQKHKLYYFSILGSIYRYCDRLRLDLCIRAAKKVAGFSTVCSQCEHLQGEITRIAHKLNGLTEPSKAERKNLIKANRLITGHLLRECHRLIYKRQHISLGVGMGVLFGMSMYIVDMDGTAAMCLWIMAVGTVVGVAIGGWSDAKAKKEGRVI